MIRVGEDFPNQVKTRLESWRCSLFYKEEKGMVTTRGRLSYKDGRGGHRTKFLKIRRG